MANMNGGHGDVDITVQSLLKCMKDGTNQPRESSPSIYTVASYLRGQQPSSYNPRVVSIGPLHRNDTHLQAAEEEKATYLFSLLSRLSDSSRVEALHLCVEKVYASIDQIRSCYAETIGYSNSELAKLMVMDGCFILEFLYRFEKHDKLKYGNMGFILYTMYDLLLLENQIPFFVLEDIFGCTISKFDQTTSLYDIIHPILELVAPFRIPHLKSTFGSNTTQKHILGILHERYRFADDIKSSIYGFPRLPTAAELDKRGVNFKRVQDTKSPLKMDVKSYRFPCFSCSWGKPTLTMPLLIINDYTVLILGNLIAYEQLSDDVVQYFTSYIMAIDSLIQTEQDIEKLIESEVLVNHLGQNYEAVSLINNLCKELVSTDFFYSKQWTELNRYYNGYWSKNITKNILSLRRTYFNSPWNIIALFAGILLFVLTVVQTIFTINPAQNN